MSHNEMINRSRITNIDLPQSDVAAIIARFEVPHSITAKYAKLYVDHAKEEMSLTDFVRRSSDDVCGPEFSSRSRTAAFRAALRQEIRSLENDGRGGW